MLVMVRTFFVSFSKCLLMIKLTCCIYFCPETINCNNEYIILVLGYTHKDEQSFRVFRQKQLEKYVITLLITHAQPEDSGSYRCKLHTADGRHTSKVLQIRVNKTGKTSTC